MSNVPEDKAVVPLLSYEAQANSSLGQEETKGDQNFQASSLSVSFETKPELQKPSSQLSHSPSNQKLDSKVPVVAIKNNSEIETSDISNSEIPEINELNISPINQTPDNIIENWKFTENGKRIEIKDCKYVFAKQSMSNSTTLYFKCMSCINMYNKYNKDYWKYKNLNDAYISLSVGSLKYKRGSKLLHGYPEKPSNDEHACENQRLVKFNQRLEKYIEDTKSKQGIRSANDEQCSKEELYTSSYPNTDPIPAELKWLLDKMECVFPANNKYRPHYLYALAPVCDTLEEMYKETFYFGITSDLQNRLKLHRSELLNRINMQKNTVMVSLLKGRHNMMKCYDLEALLINYHKMSKLNLSSASENKDNGHFTTAYEIFEVIMRKKDHADHEKMGVALQQLFEFGMKHGHRVYSSRIGQN